MGNTITKNQSIAKAFIKFQSMLRPIKKTKTVHMGGYSYTYAELSTITETIRPILAECGLAFRQVTITEPTRIGVQTILMHESGEMDCGTFFLTIKDTNPQKIGSLLSFCRRYSLQTGLSITVTNEDLDAQDLVGDTNGIATQTNEESLKQEPEKEKNIRNPQGTMDAWKELASNRDRKEMRRFFAICKNLQVIDADDQRCIIKRFTNGKTDQRSKLSEKEFHLLNDLLENCNQQEIRKLINSVQKVKNTA